MKRSEQDGEQLREKLLDDVYAGAFAGGVPAMLLEEEEIRGADDEKLAEIAERHGLKWILFSRMRPPFLSLRGRRDPMHETNRIRTNDIITIGGQSICVCMESPKAESGSSSRTG